MKFPVKIICFTIALLSFYSILLHFFPLQKTVFYTNEERIEAFVYSNSSKIVLVGSSVNGALEEGKVFDKPYFNLFLPFAGANTGLEIINRQKEVPEKLFVEIHIDRSADSTLLHTIFDFPMYQLRKAMPMFQSKNKIFNHTIDRIKKPSDSRTNEKKPADALYFKLLEDQRKLWKNMKDSNSLRSILNRTADLLKSISDKGCKIVLYEMPVDTSLMDLPKAQFQRNYFKALSLKNNYAFIPLDRSKVYHTGDGIHLLTSSAIDCIGYLKLQFSMYSK